MSCWSIRPYLLLAAAIATMGLTAQTVPPELSNRSPTGTISGRVVDAVSKEGVAGAMVSVSLDLGRTRILTVPSSTRGEFVFTGIAPGKYTIWVKKSGFLSGRFGQKSPADELLKQVDVAQLEHVGGLVVELWPFSIISGTVSDYDGSPLVGAMVETHREMFVSGYSRLVRVGAAKTDDRGRYRAVDLLPGNYVVGVQTAESLPAAFYPGSLRVADAVVLTLALGSDRGGIDIRVPLGGPKGSISGRITGLDESETPQVQLLRDEPNGPLLELPLLATTATEGRFTFDGVPHGSYLIRLVPKALRAPVIQLPVFLDRPKLDGLIVQADQGARISGRIVFDGPASGDLTQRRTLGLVQVIRVDRNDPDLPLRKSANRYPANADGEFSTERLAPGKYTLRVSDVPAGWRFESISVNGASADNDLISISSSDVTFVSVRLTQVTSPAVSGIVRDARNGIAPGSLVYVFPTDRRLWVDFGPAPRRLAMIVCGKDGDYSAVVPAGEYYFLAQELPIADSWMGAPVLERLVSAATVVVVPKAGPVQRDLTVKPIQRR